MVAEDYGWETGEERELDWGVVKLWCEMGDTPGPTALGTGLYCRSRVNSNVHMWRDGYLVYVLRRCFSHNCSES